MTQARGGGRAAVGQRPNARCTPVRLAVALMGMAGGLAAIGCTPESVRLALTFQQRADEVQAAVQERQNAALRVLLYRDLVARLERSGATLTAEARAALSAVWNDRDLVEFWRMQHERAAALRLAGVDAKLAADQSPLELLGKALQRKLQRGEDALAALAGDYVARRAGEADAPPREKPATDVR